MHEGGKRFAGEGEIEYVAYGMESVVAFPGLERCRSSDARESGGITNRAGLLHTRYAPLPYNCVASK